jgi:hypothetical protein
VAEECNRASLKPAAATSAGRRRTTKGSFTNAETIAATRPIFGVPGGDLSSLEV